MGFIDLTTGYQLIGELLMSPFDRDDAKVASLRERLGEVVPSARESIERFFANPEWNSNSEYLQTLELSPPVPLYMGAYLFEEPSTCNGIGSSSRNPYMIELTGIYQHFGLDLTGGELPDFLPIMVDFLWVSLEKQDGDRLGLRRRYVENYVQPGLEPLRKALEKYGSLYVDLVVALNCMVAEDLLRMQDTVPWTPPVDEASEHDVSLHVLASSAKAAVVPLPT